VGAASSTPSFPRLIFQYRQRFLPALSCSVLASESKHTAPRQMCELWQVCRYASVVRRYAYRLKALYTNTPYRLYSIQSSSPFTQANTLIAVHTLAYSLTETFINYELLGYNAVYFGFSPPMFRRNISPPSSATWSKPSENPAISRLFADCLLLFIA
jgi:hypothetical protein